jgi:hypothetical protein
VIVRCVVETTGKDASDKLLDRLKELGYEMVIGKM